MSKKTEKPEAVMIPMTIGQLAAALTAYFKRPFKNHQVTYLIQTLGLVEVGRSATYRLYSPDQLEKMIVAVKDREKFAKD